MERTKICDPGLCWEWAWAVACSPLDPTTSPLVVAQGASIPESLTHEQLSPGKANLLVPISSPSVQPCALPATSDVLPFGCITTRWYARGNVHGSSVFPGKPRSSRGWNVWIFLVVLPTPLGKSTQWMRNTEISRCTPHRTWWELLRICIRSIWFQNHISFALVCGVVCLDSPIVKLIFHFLKGNYIWSLYLKLAKL